MIIPQQHEDIWARMLATILCHSGLQLYRNKEWFHSWIQLGFLVFLDIPSVHLIAVPYDTFECWHNTQILVTIIGNNKNIQGYLGNL